MKHRRQPRRSRRTNIVFFLLLCLALVVTVIAVRSPLLLWNRAATTTAPQNLTVANITDRSFTLVWRTDQPTIGYISFLPAEKSKPIYDVRNKEGKKGKRVSQRTVHMVQATGLTPTSTYSFAIHSGGQQYTFGGKPFQITTGLGLVEDKKSKKAKKSKGGTKLDIVGLEIIDYTKESGDVILTLAVRNGNTVSTTIATLTRSRMAFFLLGNLRTDDLQSKFVLIPESVATVTVFTEGKPAWSYTTPIPPGTTHLRPIALSGVSQDLVQ